jgi:hypothetical protein
MAALAFRERSRQAPTLAIGKSVLEGVVSLQARFGVGPGVSYSDNRFDSVDERSKQ